MWLIVVLVVSKRKILLCELQLISKTMMDMDNTSAMDSELTPISALSKEKKRVEIAYQN